MGNGSTVGDYQTSTSGRGDVQTLCTVLEEAKRLFKKDSDASLLSMPTPYEHCANLYRSIFSSESFRKEMLPL